MNTASAPPAVPIAGSFVGAPDSYLGMTVDVTVAPENRRSAKALAG